MKEIIEGKDIIIVGQQAWDDDLGSNCRNIALEFSKTNRVLYVNYPLDRITFLRKAKNAKIRKRINIIRGKEPSIIKLSENLWNLYPKTIIESINWIRIPWAYDILNKFNNKKLAKRILDAINILGFKNIILFNDNDIARSFYLKELLNAQTSVYYSRDFMIGVEYWKRHGTRLEPKLIAKSDTCVANSVYLVNYCKQYNYNSYYVGQGCELEAFKDVPDDYLPADIKNIPSPKIGYLGSLQSIRLDIEIISLIALSKPQWQIVLVGPEDDVFKGSILHSISNIHFLGAKPVEMLPSYIQAFDVCINPQLSNEITIGNYPRKIDEYLAMGKPVVATDTDAMSIFKDYLYLSKKKEDYIPLIYKALEEDTEELQSLRKRFASGHTWENSVKEIYKAMLKTL
ncbi:glycosyltransferase [Rubrolithibacter danxiaensis]|uniref:glycosyltransferase n=1 Tax=Rubrolithibacter danxiaensis TaxID=3390805 RepID=UPI003BF9238A